MATIRKYNKSNRKPKSDYELNETANPKAKKARKTKSSGHEQQSMAVYPVYNDFTVSMDFRGGNNSTMPVYQQYPDPQAIYYSQMAPVVSGGHQGFMGYAAEMAPSTSGAFSAELVVFNPVVQSSPSTSVAPGGSSIGGEKRLVSINEAFELLRIHIPTFPYERRLSKIDTLHLAISYISLLESVLESNMSLYDYLRQVIHSSFAGHHSTKHKSIKMMPKPAWATSGSAP